MKAIAKTQGLPGYVQCIDLPVPVMGPGDVRIQIEAAGLCGTDVSIRDWHQNIAREYNPPFPLIIGHEFCGTVVEQGSAVPGSFVGRRVAVNPHLYCNACAICREGRTSVCPNRKIMGCHTNGGAAEYVVVRAGNLVPLPSGVTPEVGALGEPTAVAVHAFERSDARAWESVAIFGAGTIGLLLGLTAKALGLKRVLLVGLPGDGERLALARSLGLQTLISTEGGPATDIAAWNGGEGVDLAVEAAGAEQAVLDAIHSTKVGGRVCVVGFTHHPLQLLTTDLIFKERNLISSRAYYASTWDRTVRLLADRTIPFGALVTHRLPFERVDEGFELIQSRKCLKTIFQP